MTFSSATNQNVRFSKRGGFTLVELLVVIGIIVLIIGISLPVLNAARKKATRTRMALDLQTISTALDAYRADFKDYPRIDYSTNNPITLADRLGAVTLCWALLSPGPATQDGADGPGFRSRGTTGDVHIAYIQADKIGVSGTSDWDSTLNDTHGNPYLYFPGFKGANINFPNGYVAAYNPSTAPSSVVPPMYDWSDNQITSPNPFLLLNMQTILGCGPNGAIGVGQSPATTGPYLLWGAGPDELWGYDSSGKTDDVTNFN